MNKLTFFAASRDQLRYFSKLQQCLPEQLSVWWYKKWNLPSPCLNLPMVGIRKQIDLLQTRKQNSTAGQNKPNLYWLLFRSLKWLESIWLFCRYLGFLKIASAPYLGVWNGKKYRQAILVLAAKKTGKKVIYFETGPLPGYSCLDPQGVNFDSSLPRNATFYSRYSCAEKEVMSIIPSLASSFLPAKYIFVPFQVVEDSNIYLHSPWIQHMRAFYAEIDNLSLQNSDLNFVIKEHPACPETYEDLHEKAKLSNGRIQFVGDVNSTSLVVNAEAVITINSTVGMEAILARKKLIVLGEAIYGFEGLVKSARNRNELLAVLSELVEWQVDKVLINQYLCFVKNEYAIQCDAMSSLSTNYLQQMATKLKLVLVGKVNSAIGLED